MAGMLGHGDAFVLRDPAGIRPAFWYADDEIVVAASERPVIQTVFNIRTDNVNELDPGKALIIKASGEWSLKEILPLPHPPNVPLKGYTSRAGLTSRSTVSVRCWERH